MRPAPRPELISLFAEVLRDVALRRSKEQRTTAQQLEARLRGLEAKRGRLVELVDRGVLDEETFREQLNQNREESKLVGRQLSEMTEEVPSVEEVLLFAERVLADPGGVWEKSDLAGRQRLQTFLFPDGLRYDGDSFGTAATSPRFSRLRAWESAKGRDGDPWGI